ncbi:carboxypeptidase-like regulatory domain-containing protein [Halodesulfurarchaeum formicicum]|uniref:Muc19 n=1 Tax=Halodesulfurarchaeum formicicum TaxID=1873524 RepID=A0A1J1ADF9_9EURY|nr:carboxypeptidase-like regulatory domain-containing protein [Halodesulfurarchaeum formicicum]APE96194.1 Muc19 precursor [Halodesulfurarchaeum formicicum]
MTHQTRWTRGGLRTLAVLAMAMLVIAGTAAAVPVAPNEVYGTVSDQNGDAVDGVTVEAVHDGEVLVSTTTDSDGYYELKVPDPNDEASGETVTIRTTGTQSDDQASITWESAAVDNRDLDVEIQTDTGDGGADDGDTDDGDTDDGDTGGGGAPSGGGGADDGTETTTTTTAPPSEPVEEGLSGTEAEVAIEGDSLVAVGFQSQTELSGSVSVQALQDPPQPVPEARQFVSAAEITFSDGDGEGVDMVRLSVSQSRLDELGVTPSGLVVAHLGDDEWEELDTTVVSTDGPVVVEAPSVGFSTYAVLAQEDVTTTTATGDTPTETTEPPADTTTETPTETTTETDTPGFGISLSLVALIGAALLALRRHA